MNKNSVISSSIGNILEWYDFGLFTIFSPLFSELFFPKENLYAAVISTFTVFAIGFFCRPLGALLFGYLGDRIGRAKTIRFSILMISLPTLLIGCIPAYQTIGLAAPVILLLIRIWQGISIGGEYSGNIIYLGELADSSKKSFFTSLPAVGANLGILLAMLVGLFCQHLFSETDFKAWGWRIPYLVSGFLSLFIYLTRLKIKETPIFLEMKNNDKLLDNPITNVFKKHSGKMLQTIGLTCMGSTFYYFCFVYLPIYLNEQFRFTITKTADLLSVLMIVMIVLVPLVGLLNDKVGRYRMLVFNAVIISCVIIPGLIFLEHGKILLLIFFIFTLASSFEQGTTPAVLVENFPPEDRYTGISFAYNMSNGFLGGSIPLVCAGLMIATHSILGPGIYVTCCALVTLCFALRIKYLTSN